MMHQTYATASHPVRMAVAMSSFGGAFDVIPVIPPCVWTSTEMEFRRTSSAAEALSAVWVAAALRRPQPPSNELELSTESHPAQH